MIEAILQHWPILAFCLGLFGAWSGFLVKAIKWLLVREIDRLDGRFEALAKADAEALQKGLENEREMLRLRAELPSQYVQRDDWVRFSAVLESKTDAIHRRIDELSKEVRRGRD